MKKTVLVTGGAGFLGSHLCRELLKENNYVVCADNLSTGVYSNIKDLESNPDFIFIEQDIEHLKIGKVDEIYNLACPASPCHYQEDPVKTLKTNFDGVLNLLEIARKNSAKILQASTSEVYGDPRVHPQEELYWGNVNTTGPRACYDEGKRVAETLCYSYYQMYKIPVKIVRIFNTYGPRMQKEDGRVVSNFIFQALKGKELSIYGDGSQTRSFCYVTDMIRGLLLMMNKNHFPGPVNLGNPEEITILRLAELVLDITKSNSKILFLDLPKDDPVRRKPDITLATKVLGWKPIVNLKEGIEKTVHYMNAR